MTAAAAERTVPAPAAPRSGDAGLDRSNARVVSHLDVAEAIARRFTAGYRDPDDLRQVAYVGLVKASRRYDPSRGSDFVSFAVPTITGELKRHLRDQSWVVRPPRRVQELRLRIAKSRDGLTQELQRTPSTSDFAARFNATRSDVREALDAGNSMRPLSLDAPVREGGDELGAFIANSDSDLERAEALALLAPALKRLAPREKHIIYLRYYRGLTQQTISQTVGVTQMHVSRLLTRTLEELREALTGTRSVVRIAPDAHDEGGERRTA
ncbi:sigma-70 family RNA polymerase sigma factor [Paramicrobacterium agarici]|uniref:sigma-70 family RNA polymerase sigma factor n=1 Tax=Paramicrobacterium agarici TaxID=630514 RepID=UPI0011695AE6|nr:sigma-70 family RNA polymerase sigma factor [Microbacterium agarici]TQO21685.1 RNA polymerase sigma-B factor [Microbacterium agarici]